MNAFKSIAAAYWQSFDFGTRLSRSDFTGFALFFLIALAISYLLLGTIAVGLAAAGFPLPAALVRRGRDVGLSPLGPVFLLIVPLLVGFALLPINFVLVAMIGSKLSPLLFEGIVKFSAACAWPYLLMISFAPVKGEAKSLAASPKRPVQINPIAEAEKAMSRAREISDHVADGLGIKLAPIVDENANLQAAKDILTPLIDAISGMIAKYAHGIYSAPFNEIEVELKDAFEQGRWAPLNAADASRQMKHFQIARSLIQTRASPLTISKEVKDAGEKGYLQAQLDALIEKAAGSDQVDQSALFYEVRGLPGALGVISRRTPSYSTKILSVELFLEENLDRSIWPLTHRPEIYLAFPEEFELHKNASFHVRKLLRGHSPRQYRDGLSTEFLIAKPKLRVREALSSNNLLCPEAYLKFEMVEVMM